MPVYNKAVRDKIPVIIRASGSDCEVKVLSDEEFIPYLEQKIQEEFNEYLESKNTVELADMLEVIIRVAELRGVSWDELESMRLGKREKRGGFEKNLFLVETRD